MAKKLEEHLYRSAQTKDEYIDQNTLKKRLQMIAHGLGVPKSGGGGGASSVGMASIGGDSSNQAASPSAAAGQNGQIAQLKAMQAQAQAASGGSTYDAQSSQAQQQLNLLKQQQQQQLGIMAAMIQQSGQDGSINKEALLQQLQQQQVSSIIRLPLQFCGIYILCVVGSDISLCPSLTLLLHSSPRIIIHHRALTLSPGERSERWQLYDGES